MSFLTLYDKIGLVYLTFVNLIAFILYGVDKWKAKRDRWRIRERTLLLWAAAGGGAGALLGMKLWRHKTRKPVFIFVVPVCFVAWTVGVIWLRFF